jgi:hypothetical protein
MSDSETVRFHPAMLPTTPIISVQVASRPGNGFLKTQKAIYKNAAKPYINVVMDSKNELFIIFPLYLDCRFLLFVYFMT